MELKTQRIKREVRIRGAKLEIQEPGKSKREIWLSKVHYVVGSAPDCDIVLNDVTVSRRHFEIAWDESKRMYLVRDLGSTNGTEINGIFVKECYVPETCVIRAGKTKINFVITSVEHRADVWPEEEFFGVVGKSLRMREIFSFAFRIAHTDLNVLVEGETGVGKEELARAIHRASPRAHAPFVICDMTTISKELFLSELFGYEKGAFTGANESKAGLVEQAKGGTIFLDEIAEIPPETQAHLLRFVEKKEFKRVGATEFMSVDVRIISATAKPVDEFLKEGKFREDLFFRLAQVRIKIPPLRERPEDIPVLVRHFVSKIRDDESSKRMFLDELEKYMHMLEAYHWPGNVRELKNFVERTWALWKVSGKVKIDLALPSEKSSLPKNIFEMPFKEAKKLVVEEFESEYVRRVWEKSGHNITKSAQISGINRKYMEKLVRKYIRGEKVEDEGEE